jgi:hypothetical protein
MSAVRQRASSFSPSSTTIGWALRKGCVISAISEKDRRRPGEGAKFNDLGEDR